MAGAERSSAVSMAGSRPRPWFLRLALAVLVGFGTCVWLSVRRPDAIITKVMKVMEGLVIVCWFLSFAIADKGPRTEAQADWKKLESPWKLGLPVLIAVTAAIISEPMLGLVLLMVALGGIGFAFLIRMMNRD